MRKSQASLEYLTTYGWAFILIIVMIGALAYFGVLSPKKLLPSRCNFGAEIECKDYTLSTNGLQMKLMHNLGEPIIVDGVKAITEKSTVDCTSQLIGTAWNTAELKDVSISCDFPNDALVVGEKEKVSLQLTYHKVKSGASFTKIVSGEILASVSSIAIQSAAQSQQPQQPAFTNLLADNGFESGNLNSWITEGGSSGAVTEDKRSGLYSGKIANSDFYCNNYFYQDITVNPNTAYSISGWVKSVSERGSSGVGISTIPWASSRLSQLITGTQDWTYVKVDNYNSGSATQLRFFVTVQWCGGPALAGQNPPGAGPSGTSYFDDIIAVEGATAIQ